MVVRGRGLMRVTDLTQKFSAEQFSANPHSGTHIDSPAYLFPGGKKIGEFELERFFTEGVLLDLTEKKFGQLVDDEDLEAAEEAAGLALRERESVILHLRSGVRLSRNGAEYLEFKGVGLVGVDSVSIDGAEEQGMEAHRLLLSKDILLLEGLTNLDSVDCSRFRLVSFPLKLDSAVVPVRAVAVLE